MPENADTAEAGPYPSLGVLHAAHADLLDATDPEKLDDAAVGRIRGFLRRAAATGTAIDTAADRKAAQGLLDYWAASLYTASRLRKDNIAGGKRLPADETVLAPFDAGTVRGVAEAAERWYASRPPAGQALTRRVLSRLVTLPPDGTVAAPAPCPRSELDLLGPPEEVAETVAGLEAAGVVRAVKKDPPAQDLIALRSDAITREWKDFAGWVARRTGFRETVRYWAAQARDPAVLLRDELLDDARDYHDRNYLENEFVAAAGKRERDDNRRERRTRRWLTGLAVACAVLAVAAAYFYSRVARAAQAESRLAEEEERLAKLKAEGVQVRAALDRASALRAAVGVGFDIPLGAAPTDDNFWKLMTTNHNAKKVLLIIAAGQVLSADEPKELEASRASWERLAGEVSKDPWFKGYLERPDVADRVRRIFDASTTREVRREDVLKLSEALGKYVRGSGIQDPAFTAPLVKLKPEWYDLATLCADRLAKDAGDGRPLSEVAAFRNVFWRLYCCELILVEGDEVSKAMVKFGNLLVRWEQAPDGLAPEDVRVGLRPAAGQLRAACNSEVNNK